MKKNLILILAIFSIIFMSCSRDNPNPVVPPAPPSIIVKINEVYSRGTTDAPDWIEIFNSSTIAVDLSGYKIYDAGGLTSAKPKKEIPAGTVLQPNSWFVIVVDDTTASGFGLSSGGETVYLDNASGTMIDSLMFPALGTDTSYGRKPDGSNTLEKLFPFTKGTANGTGNTQKIIVLNEAYSRGTTEAPDWVEIYNASDFSVDISAYKIYDPGGQSGAKEKKGFPAGTVIPAKGWFVIVVDDASASRFGLSSAGDQIWLEDGTGTKIDSVSHPAMDINQSYGRYPDGSANWKLSPMSRGTANNP